MISSHTALRNRCASRSSKLLEPLGLPKDKQGHVKILHGIMRRSNNPDATAARAIRALAIARNLSWKAALEAIPRPSFVALTAPIGGGIYPKVPRSARCTRRSLQRWICTATSLPGASWPGRLTRCSISGCQMPLQRPKVDCLPAIALSTFADQKAIVDQRLGEVAEWLKAPHSKFDLNSPARHSL
jgi:hypothetical protein